MKKTINIDFDNSSSVLLGIQPDILGTKASGYALSTHTHGDLHLHLTNITGTYTSVSNGLTLNLSADIGGGGGTIHAGDNITLGTAVGHTTISAYDLASITHDHGGAPSITGLIGGTISSDAWSISIPDFLITGAASDHTHSNLMGNSTSTVSIAGTNLTLTADEIGLTIGVPRWITTAASVSHTHGSFLGTNITLVSSGSGGLALSVASKMGTSTSSNTISGSDFGMTGNTSGLTISIPKYITAGAEVSHTHGSVNTVITAGTAMKVTSSSSGLTLGIPAWITTAAEYDHTHGNILLSLDGLSGNYSSVSSGMTLSLTNSTHDHPFAGTSTAATNVGLTVNTDGIRVSLDTAGLTSFGDGVNFLAAGGSTAATNTTIAFVNANRVSFSLNGDSMSASIQEYIKTGFTTTATAGTELVATANSDGIKMGVPAFITTALVDAIKGVIISDSTYTSGSVSFKNANSISFGSSGEGIVTASISFPAQSVQPVAVSDSAQSMAFSTLSLGTNNGLTLYLANSSLVGSYTVPTQSAEPRVVSINGTSGSLSISASRNISINSSEGSALTFYGPANILNSFSVGGNTGTTGSSNITGGGFVLAGGNHVTLSQSNNTVSIFADGGVVFAAQGIASTFSTGTVALSGEANITLHTAEAGGVQYIGISADLSGDVAYDGGNTLAAGTLSAASTGYVKFVDSNGISFGLSSNSITAAIDAISRVIVSDSTMVSNSISFKNANNFSFGADGANIITLSQASHTHSEYVGLLSTGVTGASATINNTAHLLDVPQGSVYYIDNTGISWSANSSGLSTSIYATVIGGSGGTGGVQLAGSAASTVSTGLVQFANANGISFGLSSNTMTASWKSLDYIGTAYSNYWQLTESNKGLIETTYTQHTHGSNISWGNTTNTSETAMRASSSSNGLTIVVPPYITNAGAHTHGSNVSTVSTSGTATAISFSSASNGLTATIPPYAVTSHTHSNLYAYVTHTHSNSISLSTTNLLGASAASASNGFTLSISGYPSSSFVNVTETGNVYFSGTNGITFGSTTDASNNTTVTADIGSGNLYFVNPVSTGSYTSGSNMTFGSSVSGLNTSIFITAGGSTGPSANYAYSFSNGSGVTFGTSATNNTTTVTASVYTDYITLSNSTKFGQVWYLTGANTAGTTNSSHGSTLKLSGGSNVTLSGDANGNIVINVNASGAADGGNVFAAGGSTAVSTGTILFSNANGVSFGWSNSTALTASISATGGGGGAVSGSNGSFTFNTLSLGTGNGFTFYTSNSSILGSYTVPPLGTLSYINTHGVSFISSSAGSTTSISASVETAYVPLASSTKFNQIWSLIASGGSVAGTASSSFGSVLKIVAGSGITLSGGSAGITVLA